MSRTTPLGGPADDRPSIVANDRQLRDVAGDAEQALLHGNTGHDGLPVLYVRDGSIVYVRRDEKGRLLIEAVSVNRMIDRLSQVADWQRTRVRGLPEATFPPRDVAHVLLSRREIALPSLRGITEVPLLREDGSLLESAGYDPASGYVYVPRPGLMIPPVPAEPTQEQVGRAVEALDEVLVDFPFTDAASRAAVFGLLVTLACRPMIRGTAPLLLVEAPAAGTGKGLLVEAVSTILLGHPVEPTPAPGNEEEWRKKITATLASGPRLVLLDNVRGVLRSESLEAVLTSEWFSDRLLGKSLTVRFPNLAAWTMTANNGTLGGDLPRRVYLCRMDAGVEKPWERTGFRHADLLSYVHEHRGELVAAVLTLARAWVAAGRPAPADGVRALGRFEGWRHVVGGVLQVAGVAGFLENLDALHEVAASELDEWAGFLASWHRALGDRWVSAAEVTKLAEAEEITELPGGLDAGRPGFAKALGEALRGHRDAWFDGRRLEREQRGTRSKKAARWRVVESREPAGEQGGLADVVELEARRHRADQLLVVVSGESPL